MKKSFAILILILFLATPCLGDEFTLGSIQQRIHEGMSQSEIISCIGAPNIITKNAQGCESWVYDKVSESSSEVYNKGWFFLFLKGGRKGCKRTETSHKTITVMLNFDKNSCLESFSYDSRSF